MSADITKAFLQLKLNEKDQDVHRFYWDDGNSIRLMKFLRVPFGNRSSPFLLNATIKTHLAKYPASIARQELDDNLYVDDWCTGQDTDTEAFELISEGSEILGEAGLPLAKCASSSEVVSEQIRHEFGSRHLDADFIKLLGMLWMTNSDCFRFDGIEIPIDSVQLTKRMVLSFVARLFDPLGFLNPFIISLKVLFQKLWRLHLDWDQELPDELGQEFRTWISDLELVKSWEIPRCYFLGSTWNTLVDEKRLEFHMFCDAADQKGYGACVYVRYDPKGDESYKVSYVISKARVAPVKSVTLPRLELLAALLGARLLKFALEALKLVHDVNYRCWTDSTIALAWIQGNPLKWDRFVSNRVTEIQQLTDVKFWSHCPGEQNPADLLTRGISASKLIISRPCLEGPVWLSNLSLENMYPDVDTLRSGIFDSDCDISNEVSLVSVTVDPEHPFPIERWGSYNKVVRIVAYVLRLLHNLRSALTDRRFGEVTQEEFENAEIVVFSCIQRQFYSTELSALLKNGSCPRNSCIFQLTPFLGPDGLLRVKGRLQFSDLAFETKHPIILPRCHVTLLLVRNEHVFLSHAGVTTMMTSLRSKCWIVGLRSIAKKVKFECINCNENAYYSKTRILLLLPGLLFARGAITTTQSKRGSTVHSYWHGFRRSSLLLRHDK